MPNHFAVLTSSKLQIFNFLDSLDDTEFSLILNSSVFNKTLPKTEREEGAYIIDFCFSTMEKLQDFSFCSAFFLSCYGEIYYYCPILLEGMELEEEDLENLKKRIYESFTHNTSPLVTEFYEQFFKFVQDINNLQDNYYKIGPIATSKNERLIKNSFRGY